ncbi:MAG: hypothetical protein JWO36_5842 [Myxococcales bacterium]|nr:hypothetical protein [Myxococcales bacterium]
MVDRLDIDALLIGALYSELTPAEEARLTAHLESHPGDRVALDDLKSARLAVRESRILDIQLEPPQAVSAMLLQEAARRAPKAVRGRSDAEKESWFQRFAHSFMRHPAMAAAAMLVLVVGVAGTMYLKNGNQYAEKFAPANSAPAVTQSPPQGAIAERAEQAPAKNQEEAQVNKGHESGDNVGAAAGSGFQVDLAGKDQYRPTTPTTGRAKVDAPGKTPAHASKTKSKKPYIEVQANDPSPKDMPKDMVVSANPTPNTKAVPAKPSPKQDFARGLDDAETTNENVDGRAAAPGAGAPAPVAQSPKGGAAAVGATTVAKPSASYAAPSYASPPPRTPTADAKPQQPRGPVAQPPRTAAPAASPPPPPRDQIATDKTTTTKSDSPAKPAEAKKAEKSADDTLLAWAKSEHNRAISVARNGNCADAARIAVNVQNRAPDYYAQAMSTDRALKQCQQYINDARDKDAEQNAKARASKRVNSEAAPANVK